MTRTEDRAKVKWMVLIGLGCVLATGTAAAQGNPSTCENDDDCVATPQCGGDVCDWNDATSAVHTCKPAGMYPKGSDGWCTTDDDCKCHSLGATCVNAFCSFTRPCDAPGAGGCPTGGGGTSGGGGGGGGGCSVASTPPGWPAALLLGLGLLAIPGRRTRSGNHRKL
jgi:MYXO-CTERM domain-containing protein